MVGYLVRFESSINFHGATKRLIINDVTALGEGGVQAFRDESTKALYLKKWGGWSKIVQNCVTSIMDEP